jgi:tol-pal system protein YbgF
MRRQGKLLLAGGLVIMTGPFSVLAQAQSVYVDVEAERAAARAAGQDTSTAAPADPYGVKPAQAYPATSYGVNSAPATTGVVPATTAAPPPQGGPGGSSLGSLVLQVQQLQQEVMRLNGKVEEQAHELRVLKEQSMQRYVDLDKRLSEGAPAGAAAPAATGSSASAAAAPVALPAASKKPTGVAQPGEAEAYNAAYAMVRSKQFDNAILAFNQFLRDFPAGRYAPNAHYWLGELYLVTDPRDLESARQSFALLVSQYPDHNKTPDALYKLGKVQFEKGNREKAREYFDLVISQYGSSNANVADLARKFIAENY